MAQTVGGMDADAKPTWERQAVCKALLCGAAERPPSVMAGRAPEGDLPACLGQLPLDGRRIEGINTPGN
ncbi:MAG: hypothetical protein P8Y42_02920 [Exilibacterium sp.]